MHFAVTWLIALRYVSVREKDLLANFQDNISMQTGKKDLVRFI